MTLRVSCIQILYDFLLFDSFHIYGLVTQLGTTECV
jgi:hypothetical protein